MLVPCSACAGRVFSLHATPLRPRVPRQGCHVTRRMARRCVVHGWRRRECATPRARDRTEQCQQTCLSQRSGPCEAACTHEPRMSHACCHGGQAGPTTASCLQNSHATGIVRLSEHQRRLVLHKKKSLESGQPAVARTYHPATSLHVMRKLLAWRLLW